MYGENILCSNTNMLFQIYLKLKIIVIRSSLNLVANIFISRLAVVIKAIIDN